MEALDKESHELKAVVLAQVKEAKEAKEAAKKVAIEITHLQEKVSLPEQHQEEAE